MIQLSVKKHLSINPLYLGIFSLSSSTIIYEIALTKIFSVTLWYHYGFFAVSMALFGISFGGLAAYFLKDNSFGTTEDQMKHLSCWMGITMLISLLYISNTQLAFHRNIIDITKISILFILCALPFICFGTAITVVFKKHYQNIPKLYFFDLAGSAFGAVALIALISVISGPAVIITTSFLAIFSSVLFKKSSAKSLMIIVLIFICTAYLEQSNCFSIKYTKKHVQQRGIIYEKWSPLARITVYPNIFWLSAENKGSPFAWGISEKYESDYRIKQMWIEQDASAGTPITRFDGNCQHASHILHDITSVQYHLIQKGNVLILGSGGGRDVLAAVCSGQKTIDAVDINPIIVNLMKGRFKNFSGHIYDQPNIKVHVDEARNFVQKSNNRYDIIQISFIDSWAATAAGAFALSENGLYTLESFDEYINHLTDDGLLSISRFLFTPRTQSLRMAVLAYESLKLNGIKSPDKNIIVLSSRKGNYGVANILVKKTAFTNSDIANIKNITDYYGFYRLYVPGEPDNDIPFSKALNEQTREEFLSDNYYDLSPVSDNRPFFFQMMRLKNVFDIIRKVPLSGQNKHYYAVLVLSILLIVSTIAVLLFFIIPLILSKHLQIIRPVWGIYFLMIGLGFMLFEIPQIQKGTLYLGHPTYGIVAVLFPLLLFAGLGSLFSKNASEGKCGSFLKFSLLAICCLMFLRVTIFELVFQHTSGLPFIIKTLIMTVITGIVAFPLGIAFPVGIKYFAGRDNKLMPWIWALNGSASVFGSIVSMAICMFVGYQSSIILSGIIYLLAISLVFISGSTNSE